MSTLLGVNLAGISWILKVLWLMSNRRSHKRAVTQYQLIRSSSCSSAEIWQSGLAGSTFTTTTYYFFTVTLICSHQVHSKQRHWECHTECFLFLTKLRCSYTQIHYFCVHSKERYGTVRCGSHASPPRFRYRPAWPFSSSMALFRSSFASA